MEIEWTPPPPSPRRLLDDDRQGGGQPRAIGPLDNPVIRAAFAERVTGRPAQAPVSGIAGREYLQALDQAGIAYPGWDFSVF